jgi:CRISPR-associated protein Cas2
VLVVVTYDVNTETPVSRKRLRKVAQICKNRGQRVQKSVFECLVDPAQWAVMRQKLVDVIDTKQDSLRFYFLGSNWKNRVEQVGENTIYDPEGPIVV